MYGLLFVLSYAQLPFDSVDLHAKFVQKQPLSRCGSLDWPCRFVEDRTLVGRRFVVGFHSVSLLARLCFTRSLDLETGSTNHPLPELQTCCLLVDLSTGWVVWRTECGGGNRHWQFELREGVAKLTFIRDEVRGF